MAEYMSRPPADDDLRTDDQEYDPAIEPKSALAWLNLLEEAEDAFEDWNCHCDNVDRLYANLEQLSTEGRDKTYSLFWANCEVLKPAIYSKAPVPVVTTKFKDRRPVPQQASEMLERCAIVNFDMAYINDIMLQLRDDLAMVGRGVAWCRYESGKGDGLYDHEKVCIDFKHRRDFLHSISRCWYEVTWVAAASYLTRSEARDRFYETSGLAYQDAEYKVDKDSQEIGGADARERAKFWEIWHKGERRVVWVAQGCQDILDEGDPHLNLQGFFPCPKPAYGTCQRGSLIPVPDVMQYKDQLDEVNLLTSRIHALSDALEARGFYPAGDSELSEAVQAAVQYHTPGRVLVPIKNWATFGGTKEVVIWLPIDMIAQVVTALVSLRKEVISDIYQIMGLSDIMRGATDPQETLGAQELKTQYGSTRIRDKQYELVRIARDLVQITSEVMCQKFDDETMIEMSQTSLKTEKMQRQEAQKISQQIAVQRQMIQQQMMQSPQDPQTAQASMQQMSTGMQQAQQQIQKIVSEPTIEQVLTFLRDNRTRTFVLDIETDSTIMADENAEKQRRTEFVGMLGNLLPALAQLIAGDPNMADFAGDILKFSVAPFRAERALGSSIDTLVETVKAKGAQGKGDDPQTAQGKIALQIEQIKQQRQAERDKADVALKAQELQMRDAQEKAKIQSNENIKVMELRQKQGDDAAKANMTNQKAMAEREKSQAELLGKHQDMAIARQKADMDMASHIAKQADMASRASERQAAQQFKQANQGMGL